MNKPTRYYSDKQEKRTAKELNAKVQVSSGSSQFFKGDVISENCLIECKTNTTEKKSFSIKKEWLEKVSEQAFSMRKRFPILAFDFGSDENYYVLNEKTFKQFIRYLETLWNNFQNSADKFYIYQHFSIIINIEIYVGGNYYE